MLEREWENGRIFRETKYVSRNNELDGEANELNGYGQLGAVADGQTG